MALINPTYAFNSITARKLLDEAFLLCGIPPEKIGNVLINSGIFSINMVITDWINDGVIQFNETQTLVKLQNGLTRYILPRQFYDVYDFNLATMGRRSVGIPFTSAGGNAVAVFDGNLNTACTQTSTNGAIGIDFDPQPEAKPIRVDFFGILSNADTFYQIVVEGSNDNTNWITLHAFDRPYFFKGDPFESQTQWFQIDQPQIVRYLRIRETGGNKLNIRELYFEQYIQTIYRKNVGRSTYMQLTSRSQESSPSLYSLEKQSENVVVNIYQSPANLPVDQEWTENAEYQNFALLRAVEYPLDVNFLLDKILVNRLFYPALVWGVAKDLAPKVNRADLVPVFLGLATSSYEKAKTNNNDLGGLNVTRQTYSA